jgi:hypothetical protein
MNYSFGRHPIGGNATVRFQGGTSLQASAAAWSVAGVIAISGTFTKMAHWSWRILVNYAAFPSMFYRNIMVTVAQNVYSRHHDAERWELEISKIFRATKITPGNMGSPYVPIDSWVYPAFDRLAAWVM